MKRSLQSAFFLLLFTSFIFNACKKTNKILVLKPGKLTSFVLERASNQSILDADLKAVIKEDDKEIELSLPKGIDVSKVIAKFEYEGKKISLNGVEQQSGITINDFSKPITYEILGENNQLTHYKLKINTIDDDDLKIEKFWIDKNLNPSLMASINFELTNDILEGTAANTDNKTFKINFTSTAKQVLINNATVSNGVSEVNFGQLLNLTLLSNKGFRKDYTIKINWANEIPQINIVTENNAPIVSKEIYLTGTVSIDGKGRYESLSASPTKVKGRGNSTWRYSKKPYRLKLDNKTSVLGLPKAKNWVLLANYLDPTLMLNSVALKMGQLLNIPYTHNFIPVELKINNEYMGSYLLTEQVEVDENRVNVGKDGLLLELDSYFDEDYKFKSTNYQLPVMIKYPELTKQEDVLPIQQQFQALEDLIFSNSFPNNNYLEYFDKDNFVKFILVFMMADNEEINHPKSTYINKTKDGKYSMGPIWDFDWAWGYEGSNKHFSTATRPLFHPIFATKPGYKFFSRIMTDPAIKVAFKTQWASFKANQVPVLLRFVDDYAKLTANAKARDYQLWKKGDAVFMNDVAKLKQYLQDRVAYIDTYVSSL